MSSYIDRLKLFDPKELGSLDNSDQKYNNRRSMTPVDKNYIRRSYLGNYLEEIGEKILSRHLDQPGITYHLSRTLIPAVARYTSQQSDVIQLSVLYELYAGVSRLITPDNKVPKQVADLFGQLRFKLFKHPITFRQEAVDIFEIQVSGNTDLLTYFIPDKGFPPPYELDRYHPQLIHFLCYLYIKEQHDMLWGETKHGRASVRLFPFYPTQWINEIVGQMYDHFKS